MMARLSSDPQVLLGLIDEADSDYSDDDFDGYIDDSMDKENLTHNIGADENAEERMNGNVEMDSDMNDNEMDEECNMVLGGSLTADGSEAVVPRFSETPGSTFLTDNLEPIDFFRQLWTDNLNEKILDETNKYGQQYVDEHQQHLSTHPRARAHDFVKCKFTIADIKNFLAIVLIMGVVSLPRVASYWSTQWPFSSESIRKVLSRDRFQLISKFLHLSDNSTYVTRGQDGHDRLYKIRPLITYLISSFKNSYIPDRELSVDESMVSYKGRLSFLQYLPKKPQKWGMKAWVLAESKTGYTWNWDLYTGKLDQQDTSLPLSMRVVLSLCSDLKLKGYHVYFDNFYTSPDLCRRLLENGFGSCGTVRTNRRGIPKTFREKKLKKGEVTTYNDGQILGLKWMDKRPVAVLTTIHDNSMMTITRRTRSSEQGTQTIQKPTVIEKYNTYMGGVDKADQLVTYYGYPHFSKKWWKRVFFHLLDTTIVNAYILYKQSSTTNKLSHMDFQLAIAQSLISDCPRQPHSATSPSDTPQRLMGQHFPEPGPSRDCKVCSHRATAKRKRSTFKCDICNVTLCIHPCFKKYHTLKKYN